MPWRLHNPLSSGQKSPQTGPESDNDGSQDCWGHRFVATDWSVLPCCAKAIQWRERAGGPAPIGPPASGEPPRQERVLATTAFRLVGHWLLTEKNKLRSPLPAMRMESS